MQYLKKFAFSIGTRYQELVPLADLVSPNKTEKILNYEGWAYCARTQDKNIFLVYFEKGYPYSDLCEIRGARLNSFYKAQWFNPRNGSWMNAGTGELAASNTGIIKFPALPDQMDWGLRLVYKGQNDKDKILPFIPPTESSIKKFLRKHWPGKEENRLKKIIACILVTIFLVLLTARVFGNWRHS
jgi:hypothetical protein